MSSNNVGGDSDLNSSGDGDGSSNSDELSRSQREAKKARALAATPADAGDAHNALLAALKGNPRANMKRVQSKAALEMAAARASAAGADGAS